MSGQWYVHQTAPDTVHAVPLDDHIVHEYRDDCPCGPTPETTEHGEGRFMVHHSLDGRETREG